MIRRARFRSAVPIRLVVLVGALVLLSACGEGSEARAATTTTVRPTSTVDFADVSTVPPYEGSPDDPYLTSLMDDYDVDLDGARTIAGRQAQAEGLVPLIAEFAAEEWAGSWLADDGTTMHVAVAGREGADRLRAQRLPEWVVVDTVDHSLERLDRTLEELGEQLSTLPAGTAISGGVEVRRNRVVVEIRTGDPSSERVRRAVADYEEHGAVLVEVE